MKISSLDELLLSVSLIDVGNCLITCGDSFSPFFLSFFSLFSLSRYIKGSLLNENDSMIVETLLFGSNSLNDEENAFITESAIEYIITTERFITPLL